MKRSDIVATTLQQTPSTAKRTYTLSSAIALRHATHGFSPGTLHGSLGAPLELLHRCLMILLSQLHNCAQLWRLLERLRTCRSTA